mmetsp:Transcript_3364/g.7970  ORF Transcript_3364/g.7970 Transcript_3364/m.7970 type:complete len:96 (+) Transcript_3364:1214-1501(+)
MEGHRPGVAAAMVAGAAVGAAVAAAGVPGAILAMIPGQGMTSRVLQGAERGEGVAERAVRRSTLHMDRSQKQKQQREREYLRDLEQELARGASQQ